MDEYVCMVAVRMHSSWMSFPVITFFKNEKRIWCKMYRIFNNFLFFKTNPQDRDIHTAQLISGETSPGSFLAGFWSDVWLNLCASWTETTFKQGAHIFRTCFELDVQGWLFCWNLCFEVLLKNFEEGFFMIPVTLSTGSKTTPDHEATILNIC